MCRDAEPGDGRDHRVDPGVKPVPLPDGLSPLETALIQALQVMHSDVVASTAQLSGELRAFRLQFLGALVAMVLFLIGIVASLKGVDPRIAAEAVQVIAPVAAPPAAGDGSGIP